MLSSITQSHSSASRKHCVCHFTASHFHKELAQISPEKFFPSFFACSVSLNTQYLMTCCGFGSSFPCVSPSPLQGFLPCLFCTATLCFDSSLSREPRFSEIMKPGLVGGGYFYLLLAFQETFPFKLSKISPCCRSSLISSFR